MYKYVYIFYKGASFKRTETLDEIKTQWQSIRSSLHEVSRLDSGNLIIS